MMMTHLAAIVAALCLFGWLGLRARKTAEGLDDYMTARNSQGATTIGLSFLASGMGAWILFAPPEVGAFVGPVALAGYALGAALPFIVFAALGPLIRKRLPQGRSINEFAEQRFGKGLRRWVSLVSVLYMLCFLAAELTAIGSITALLSDLNGDLVIIAVAVTTLIYTTWGGLRASLATDRWQALLLMALLAAVLFVDWKHLPSAAESADMPGIPFWSAVSVALTLVLAVTAANLFHQGYWQRVWAARDSTSLWKGAILGGGTTIVVVAVVGGLGMSAAMAGLDLGQPPIPFFALLNEAPQWLGAVALVLAVTLVASSVDTLQNGIASLAVAEKAGLTLAGARWLTVALMVPVVLVALQGASVLRLFLIADLLCATAIIPVLMGLWPRVSTTAAMAGVLAGLIGAILPDWAMTGSLKEALYIASFPGGAPTLAPFAGAILASAGVTLLLTLIGSKRAS
ncbi:sodium:solute symporter family transporter [Marinobacter persicus]|jgi:Na+/proline symporter|uniref:Na+/proline symporter n=1 Tax=Marinobacter persicus TaxID=930118 RepID=A0A2S6G325_9GAMM|nr:sodium:solute symporter [Marinobacter persicus]PPK50256.1 Na+/proline symporter [Marinobacter persicus]PPK52881.1 Na+/proline symporter [Marinobacter persicus]PPK56744.1 Na+/proline symporter [Marinobacter persicus]